MDTVCIGMSKNRVYLYIFRMTCNNQTENMSKNNLVDQNELFCKQRSVKS